MKSGIYKIESPSGKIYIGQSIDLDKRICSYKKIHTSRKQIKLNNSFKKYSVDKHIFSIVERCDINMLNIKERYYQELFECIGCKGLNLKLQGANEIKQVHSQETLDKISYKMKLKHKEVDYKNKMVSSRKGKPLSEKALNALSLRNKKYFDQRGFKNNNAKLTQEIYNNIKKDRELGMTYNSLKLKYNLKSNGHLCNILKS
jgi:group I intron endonuclease